MGFQCRLSGYATHSVFQSMLLGSHLDAFDGLVDGLEQGSVLWVLIALFIGEHVGQCVHIGVKVLFGDWLLL